jgi:hypothetical protein
MAGEFLPNSGKMASKKTMKKGKKDDPGFSESRVILSNY